MKHACMHMSYWYQQIMHTSNYTIDLQRDIRDAAIG
jgi:hypothetical protein